MGSFVGWNINNNNQGNKAPYNPQQVAPQPGADTGGCCSECYSNSLGNSALIQNPIAIPSNQAVQICNPNPSRKELFLINTSSDIVYIGLGYSPGFSNGIGVYSFSLAPCLSANDDGTGGIFVSDMWQGAIFALSATGAGILNFTEEV